MGEPVIIYDLATITPVEKEPVIDETVTVVDHLEEQNLL